MSRTRAPYPARYSVTRLTQSPGSLLAISLYPVICYPARSPGVVVRRLDGHLDVMRVTLLQAGGGDPDHPRGLQVGDGTRSGVPHGLAQPADELVGHRGQRAPVRHLALDALRHQLVVGGHVVLEVPVLGVR